MNEINETNWTKNDEMQAKSRLNVRMNNEQDEDIKYFQINNRVGYESFYSFLKELASDDVN